MVRIKKPYWLVIKLDGVPNHLQSIPTYYDTKSQLMKAISKNLVKGKVISAGYMGKNYEDDI